MLFRPGRLRYNTLISQQESVEDGLTRSFFSNLVLLTVAEVFVPVFGNTDGRQRFAGLLGPAASPHSHE